MRATLSLGCLTLAFDRWLRCWPYPPPGGEGGRPTPPRHPVPASHGDDPAHPDPLHPRPRGRVQYARRPTQAIPAQWACASATARAWSPTTLPTRACPLAGTKSLSARAEMPTRDTVRQQFITWAQANDATMDEPAVQGVMRFLIATYPLRQEVASGGRAQPALPLDERGDRVHALAGADVGEHERPLATHPSGCRGPSRRGWRRHAVRGRSC